MAQDVVTELGPISRVTPVERLVLSRDVALDIQTIHAAWPKFESALDSLKGRPMTGLIYNRVNLYRLATSKLERVHQTHRLSTHVHRCGANSASGQPAIGPPSPSRRCDKPGRVPLVGEAPSQTPVNGLSTSPGAGVTAASRRAAQPASSGAATFLLGRGEPDLPRGLRSRIVSCYRRGRRRQDGRLGAVRREGTCAGWLDAGAHAVGLGSIGSVVSQQ